MALASGWLDSVLDGCGLRDQPGLVAVKSHHIRHDRFAERQRAGLVEGHGFGACQHLDNRTALHQHTVPCRSRKAGGDGSGNGNDECAGATDQKQGETAINPGVPVAKAHKRRHDDGKCGNRDDQRHVITREVLDEALGRGAGVLCFFNERDDAGNGVVFRRPVDPNAQRTVMVDRTRKDACALFLGDRNALAGHRRFVDAGFAFHHHAIGGNAVARTRNDHLTDANLIGGHLPKRTVFFHQCRFRQQGTESLDARAGTRGGKALQQLANGEQQHDDGRFFRLANDDGADGGNRHQHLYGEDRAETRGVEGVARDGKQRDQRCDDEGVTAPCREAKLRRIGDGHENCAGEGVPCLGGAPPHTFFIRAMGVAYLGALRDGFNGRVAVRVLRIVMMVAAAA